MLTATFQTPIFKKCLFVKCECILAFMYTSLPVEVDMHLRSKNFPHLPIIRRLVLTNRLSCRNFPPNSVIILTFRKRTWIGDRDDHRINLVCSFRSLRTWKKKNEAGLNERNENAQCVILTPFKTYTYHH